jgi:pimeloyl-ACP methyl ester carboxylesterase
VQVPAQGEPTQFAYFLHGIFGAGGNLRGIAKAWLEGDAARFGPRGFAAVLVDLRKHGRSQDFAPPHTVLAAAEDIVVHAQRSRQPVSRVVGHSFGGKVALALVDLLQGDLERACILDSMPGDRVDRHGSETTMRVFSLLRALPATFARREVMIDALVSQGLSRDLSSWLAMNLVPAHAPGGGDPHELRMRLELDAIEALLNDYFVQDYWHVLERPQGRVSFDLVIGGASTVFDQGDLTRAKRIAGPRTRVTILPGASHYVHVDAPAEIVRLLTT